jgi:hypothetical protein
MNPLISTIGVVLQNSLAPNGQGGGSPAASIMPSSTPNQDRVVRLAPGDILVLLASVPLAGLGWHSRFGLCLVLAAALSLCRWVGSRCSPLAGSSLFLWYHEG